MEDKSVLKILRNESHEFKNKKETIQLFQNIRTPLNVILGSAQILSTEQLTLKQIELIQNILDSCTSLLKSIEYLEVNSPISNVNDRPCLSESIPVPNINIETQFLLRSPIDSEMSKTHPLKILLAEDNPLNQKIALKLLSKLGYSADVACNGQETFEMVLTKDYDVILMDIQMPIMTGIEVTARIRSIQFKNHAPYIIALTANCMQGDRECCLKAGMNDYASKPIMIENLMNALRKVPKCNEC